MKSMWQKNIKLTATPLDFFLSLLIAIFIVASMYPRETYAGDMSLVQLSKFCEKESNDSLCVQNAFNYASRNAEGFGSIIADKKRAYNISKTIIICNSSDGVFDGAGAAFNWVGPPNMPMFLVINGRHMRFENFNIFSSPKGALNPLQAGMEFTSDLTNKSGCEGPVIPSSKNSIDHVRMEGRELNGLIYGIRFTNRFGDDANNDMSTIFDVTLNNITNAGISIEHTQSHQHRLISVNGYGAPGNNGCFVDARAGFISVVGGFQGGWGEANFCFDGAYGPFSVVDANSEGSSRLIEIGKDKELTGFPMNVSIQGGRFAVNNLNRDGSFVNINRLGSFLLRGITIDGVSTTGNFPKITVMPGSRKQEKRISSVVVEGLSFYVIGAKVDHLFNLSDAVEAIVRNNVCFDDTLKYVTSCPGN